MAGKLIIFSAPSGSGKSTIVQYLIAHCNVNFTFSVSATSRAPRGTEQHGVAYYFISTDEFRKKIEENAFVEYEEVYPDCFYGTLKSEVDKALAEGKTLLFDVDVKGGLNIKRQYGNRALAIFIQPPSVDELRRRLVARATDSSEMVEQRVNKAEWEMQFASQFDVIIVNDNLEKAKTEATKIVMDFLK
ncbi:MAG: guanylate kinase [Paludibacteraceae bacterium]|jgi:guanylate kinase|nr:guanylate kinase [Paludibacteraceae bacterium]MDI9536424.1 guanylate kinase [Bacteroidota bacterium]OQC34646.1 MAG: Guanylate kinase [Bacteroidetes bacterium ADurb.Bin057]HHT60643.1 guanylate kinase [Bacteroidales bacterium]MBP9039324.1 guanylate kinase [Paludibacteraceae bacterium]